MGTLLLNSQGEIITDRQHQRERIARLTKMVLSPRGGLEPKTGIEPVTYGLRNRCSTS